LLIDLNHRTRKQGGLNRRKMGLEHHLGRHPSQIVLSSHPPWAFLPAQPDLGLSGASLLGASRNTMNTTESKKEVNLKEFQLHDGDTGSAPYQVALLTQRILHLTDHLIAHNKDFSSRRGLLKMVSQRRKLLDYIKKGSEEKYQQVIQGLGLRH
jgi:small subunit ribosomal protein S15